MTNSDLEILRHANKTAIELTVKAASERLAVKREAILNHAIEIMRAVSYCLKKDAISDSFKILLNGEKHEERRIENFGG